MRRFIKWIRNWNGNVTKKVQNAAKVTLEEAYRLAVDNKQYIRGRYTDGSWIFKASLEYSDRFSDFYPINEVACKLSHSKQFASIDKNTYDLFKKNIFYCDHTTYDNTIYIPTFYKCHQKKEHNPIDFHHATHDKKAHTKFSIHFY